MLNTNFELKLHSSFVQRPELRLMDSMTSPSKSFLRQNGIIQHNITRMKQIKDKKSEITCNAPFAMSENRMKILGSFIREFLKIFI